LCKIVSEIKNKTGLAVTLSVGEKPYADYPELKNAGADRYLLRFETSDKKLFEKMKPGSSYSRRFECLDVLKKIGFQTGSGILIGLPGQTLESIADDIMLFKKMKLDMVGVGPFIAHPDTPLAGYPSGSMDLTLRVVALARIATRVAHIPATTAMGTLDPFGRQKALMCGANVLMPNVGPVKYRKKYMLYPGKICVGESPSDCRGCMENMIKSLGRKKSAGFGHSLRGVKNGKNA